MRLVWARHEHDHRCPAPGPGRGGGSRHDRRGRAQPAQPVAHPPGHDLRHRPAGDLCPALPLRLRWGDPRARRLLRGLSHAGHLCPGGGVRGHRHRCRAISRPEVGPPHPVPYPAHGAHRGAGRADAGGFGPQRGLVAVMTGVGFAVGFRVHNGLAGLLAALGLVAVFAHALSWAFVALGLRVSDPEAAQAAGVPFMFLLVFTSDAFLPLRSMPGWLQAIGAHQPVTALVDAERSLTLGGPAHSDVVASLAWSAGMLLVFAALAARTYRHMDR